MLHPELEGLLIAVDAAERDAISIASGLSDNQINWQPGPGQWSIAQCLDHLTRMNSFYVGHFLDAAKQSANPGPFRGLRPSWFGRQFIADLDAPPKRRRKTPWRTAPASSIPASGVIEAYVRSHDAYRELLRIANQLDVNRVTASNPFIKAVRMRIATVLFIIPAHDRRHLWQARQVLQASGFPL